jgi:hypothetical protein
MVITTNSATATQTNNAGVYDPFAVSAQTAPTSAALNDYPDIDYATIFKIYTVGQNMRSITGYLNNSPYSEPIKKALGLIFNANATNSTTGSVIGELDTSELDIRKESEILYYQTKEILGSNTLDEKDKASVLKTATTLLEKLLNIIERSENISQMREFETKVLMAMKKVTPEIREQFLDEIDRLEHTDRETVNEYTK